MVNTFNLLLRVSFVACVHINNFQLNKFAENTIQALLNEPLKIKKFQKMNCRKFAKVYHSI